MKIVEQSSCEEKKPTQGAQSYWQVQFETFKRGLLMLVRAKCKTNFTTKIYFNRKIEVLVCTAVAYREKVFCN